MRTFSLVRVAADAELLRLRLRARRAAVRAILALVALGFLAGAAVFCHLALGTGCAITWSHRKVP